MGRRKESSPRSAANNKNANSEHVNMDIWHGLLPNEDTANLVKEDGDFLMRGIEKEHVYSVILSVRWGKDVSSMFEN